MVVVGRVHVLSDAYIPHSHGMHPQRPTRLVHGWIMRGVFGNSGVPSPCKGACV